jgi:CRISPR-associated protein Cmr3
VRIKIDALDTLVFGRGKPSVWGEDTFGEGMFPPYPSVVRGAARANWLFVNGSQDIATTEQDPTKDYSVTEYCLLVENKPFYRAPADFVWDSKTLVPCVLKKNDGLSNLTTEYQLCANANDKVETAEGRFISLECMQSYLNDVSFNPQSLALSELIESESRIGIFKNRHTNTVKESMLYRAPLLRLENKDFKKLSIVANIDEADEIGGLTRFGGENKVAMISDYKGKLTPLLPELNGNIFKLYLATPAFFREGWNPKIEGVQLLAAAVYGYESIGGFDLKKQEPKPMRRAVRAGSVYYYRITDESKRKDILELHGKSISHYQTKDGFGICFIGNAREEN